MCSPAAATKRNTGKSLIGDQKQITSNEALECLSAATTSCSLFLSPTNGDCCRMEAHTRTKWQDDESEGDGEWERKKGREGEGALTRKKTNSKKTVSVHNSEGFSLSGLMPRLLMEIGSHNSPRLRLTNPRIFISKNNGMENHSPCSMSCSNTYGVQRCRDPSAWTPLGFA